MTDVDSPICMYKIFLGHLRHLMIQTTSYIYSLKNILHFVVPDQILTTSRLGRKSYIHCILKTATLLHI